MRQITSPSFKLAAFVLAAVATAAAAAAAPTYRIELVPKGNGIVPTSAYAISDNGNIAGYGRLSGSKTTATFLAPHGGKPVVMDGSQSAGSGRIDVNDAGEVTGNHLDHQSVQGALWLADGTLVDLGTLAGCDAFKPLDYTSPGGLNGPGDVLFHLHCSRQGVAIDAPVVWQQGTLSVLPTLGGTHTYSSDLNDAGQVAGSSEQADGSRRAFIWHNGTMTSLGTLGGLNSYGSAISELGHVAGSSSLADGSSRTFLHDGSVMHELPLCEGKRAIEPVGVTTDDLVVGVYGSRQNRRTALIQNGQCQLLTTHLDASGPSWTNLSARGVNNHGVIVGEGDYLGQQRAFKATPIGR
ncbi:hypothetical protein AACH06_27060 [Ideonella sp. DXS29W]|uniref:HAF repeat-containing protein n=1 Tax=Ideonella lacteola TaxID=2984193 RepID=A0ABU9BX97_9BURK